MSFRSSFRAGDADEIRWFCNGIPRWPSRVRKTDSVVPGECHLDKRGVTDYKWAVTQGVGTDGSDHKGFHGGMYDGSAGGERIGGRAGGAGHDQAVGVR